MIEKQIEENKNTAPESNRFQVKSNELENELYLLYVAKWAK